MVKRDRAAYMRAYRAKRAKGEGVSAPSPVGELRDGDLIEVVDSSPGSDMPKGVYILSRSIQSMSQAERDRILRKLTK